MAWHPVRMISFRRRQGTTASASLAALATASVLLAGCSGSSDAASSSSTAPTSGSPSGSGSAAPSPSTSASSTAAPTAALTPAAATQAASQVFSAAAQSQTGNSAAAAAARDQAFTGAALRTAVADARLARIAPQLTLGTPAITAEHLGVLAISQGTGYPRAIVVQTTPKASLYPVIYLLTSPNAATAFRIASSALLLPAAAVHRFGPLASGSPLVTSGSGLVASPVNLLNAYAKGLSYPVQQVANPPYAPGDRFASQVRQNAAAEAAAVKVQAGFTQRHQVLPTSTVAVRQADGGALVFGVMQRTDSFAVKKTQKIKPSGGLLAFEPKLKAVTSKAQLTTLEAVVLELPARGSSGAPARATLVAASEHLVAGSGS
jgi:hypothetical protein